MGFQILNNHIGKVMDVDDYIADVKVAQTGERNLKQRAAANFHQRLGAVVGERTQARTLTAHQDNRVHLRGIHRGNHV